MRAEPLGTWLAVVATAWLATGCATLVPLSGPGRALQPARHVPHATGLQRGADSALQPPPSTQERLRRRRPVRMPVGTAVAVGGMGVLAAETGMLELDAFEKLLVHAGLDPTEEAPPRVNPLTPDKAARVLAHLLQKPMTLGNLPPRMAAASLLREVLEGGEVSREELLRRVERFDGIAVLRPDGYLAWTRNGRTQQKVASVVWKEGAFRAHAFELGRFYTGRGGVFRPVDSQLQAVDGPALAEVYDDADVINRTLDGAEVAFIELYHALGQLFTRPLDSLAALRHLPAGVAALIASSPAYWERFQHMTAGEQMEAVARLTTNLIVTWGAASATTRTLGGLLAGAEAMPVLSLSAEGALVMERIAVPVGQAAAVLGGGPGGAIILHRANTAATGPSPGGGPGQWGPAKESMTPSARRYQEQLTGHSADDAYWVGGTSTQAGGIKFDGFKDGVLLEAKGPNYANKFQSNLDPKHWFKNTGAQELIDQAQRQSDKVRSLGIPIEWHVAEKHAANAIRKLLDDAGIKGIKVIHTPAL